MPIDLIVKKNEVEKEIRRLNFNIKYGNYGSQTIQCFRELLKEKEEELETLKEKIEIWWKNNGRVNL